MKKTAVVLGLISSSVVIFFQNCAPPQSGSELHEGGEVVTVSPDAQVESRKFSTLKTCEKIRYSFKTFSPEIKTQSGTYYGGVFYPYGNATYPWMVDRPISNYNLDNLNTYRLSGYVAESNDCGDTWIRTPEYINPMILNGGPDNPDFCTPNSQRANGVNHFITNQNANFFSQGFVSQIRWDAEYLLRSRIYSVFNAGGTWSYAAVAKGEPYPAIGNLSWNVPDNFYSPSIVETGDAQKTIQLYFGGWRARVVPRNGATLPACRGPSGVITGANSSGYLEKDCTCSLSEQLGMAIDSCTGDKIFMATNKFSTVAADKNSLRYQIYRPSNNTYSDNAWDSSLFEPVIYPAMINKGCHLSDRAKCPFPILHTNDPTVVRFPYAGSPSGFRQVMYFTGGVVPPTEADPSPGYTHSAISDNEGKTWSKFAILNKSAGLQFPGGLTYNQANGTVRAYYRSDGATSRILLMSVTTPDNTLLDNSQADANKIFIYEIDPARPDLVISIRKIDKDEHGISRCEPNVPCATSQPYISQIKAPTNRLDCKSGSVNRKDGMLGSGNGDKRFLCSKGSWYSCGWNQTSPTVISARDTQAVANYTCNTSAKAWVIQKPSCQNDCSAGGNIGKDGKVGLPNGDSRFLCSKGAWYDCGWELTDLSWESKAKDGDVVGMLKCDLKKRRWIAK